MRRGRFISVEGGEGVGKSVFLAGLGAALTAARVPFVATREPGGTPAADRIRALFGAPPDGDPFLPVTEALLVSAARAQHVGRRIAPTLAAGTWVVSDRYHDSMRVYQGALGGVAPAFLEQLIAGSTAGLDPDLTFLLDVDVGVAQARLQGRRGGEADAIARYDDAQVAAHETLRSAFLDLARRWPQRIVVLDAGQAPEAVVADAVRALRDRFGGEMGT